jgi:four helix bundle protein
MKLEDLEVYKIALEISNLAWEIYNELPREHRLTQGSQFLEAADSTGANIAEGFGRYHYRDSLKFYYNSRGSLLVLKHWNILLINRSLAKSDNLSKMKELIEIEHFKLNSFINSIKSRNLQE